MHKMSKESASTLSSLSHRLDEANKLLKKKDNRPKVSQILEDMDKLVDMYWPEEIRHWEENGNPQDHIFHSWNNIKNWLIGRLDKKENNNGI